MLCMELMALEICLYGATLSFSTAPMEVYIHTHNIKLVYAVISGVTVIALSVNVQSEDSGLLNSVQWNSGEYIKQTASGMRPYAEPSVCVWCVCIQVWEGSLLC